MSKCMACGKEFESKRSDARFCSGKCRMKTLRDVTDNISEVVTDKSVTDNVRVEKTLRDVRNADVTFLGRKVGELDLEEEIEVGYERMKVGEVPCWLLEGELERDKLPMSVKRHMPAQEKRRRFRELMFSYDVRYGARDANFDLMVKT